MHFADVALLILKSKDASRSCIHGCIQKLHSCMQSHGNSTYSTYCTSTYSTYCTVRTTVLYVLLYVRTYSLQSCGSSAQPCATYCNLQPGIIQHPEVSDPYCTVKARWLAVMSERSEREVNSESSPMHYLPRKTKDDHKNSHG